VKSVTQIDTTKPKRVRKKPAGKKAAAPPPSWKGRLFGQRRLLLLRSFEIGGLVVAALIATIAGLGLAAGQFGGAGFWTHLLPFAAAVLLLSGVFAVFLKCWLTFRGAWLARHACLPAVLSMLVAGGAVWYALQAQFAGEVGRLRTMVGGLEEAERTTLSHQVYANYRRSDLKQMEKIIQRAEVYRTVIDEAGRLYGVDPEILVGLGAAESSFYPRDSKDGGKGLFQITAPPQSAMEEVRKRLRVEQLDMLNQRHNAHAAAATFRHYLAEMKGDLFLGLLAYNIGPKNGGLRSIVQQYGVHDFVTIQPYLQNLPRDYPIRVLTASLAYRLWQREGKLPRYEEGKNALLIQRQGIPGINEGG
jgi:hypothetical protein